MVLPLGMLRTIRMRLSQKIGLSVLFSLAGISIIFDIIRTSYTANESGDDTIYRNVIFNMVELASAVIVSCLIVYRMLLGSAAQKTRASLNLRGYQKYARSNDKSENEKAMSNRTEIELLEIDTLEEQPKRNGSRAWRHNDFEPVYRG